MERKEGEESSIEEIPMIDLLSVSEETDESRSINVIDKPEEQMDEDLEISLLSTSSENDNNRNGNTTSSTNSIKHGNDNTVCSTNGIVNNTGNTIGTAGNATGTTTDNMTKENVKTQTIGHIDQYTMMIISKYFNGVGDYVNIEKCSKEYRGLMEMFRYNPMKFEEYYEHEGKMERKFFKNVETYNIYEGEEEGVFTKGQLGTWDNISDKRTIDKVEEVSREMLDVKKEPKNIKKIVVIPDINLSEIEPTAQESRLPFYKRAYERRMEVIGNPNIEFKGLIAPLRKELYKNDGVYKEVYDKVNKIDGISDEYARSEDLKEVKIPNQIVSIEPFTFGIEYLIRGDLETTNQLSKITKIESIFIPSTVSSIKKGAFCNCKSLTKIELPESIEVLEARTFEKCSRLSDIKIPVNVYSIKDRCFYGCKNLDKIQIPTTVTYLGEECFRRCTKLSRIIIPTRVSKLDTECFMDCWKLSTIDIPSSVSYIGFRCFSGNTSLSEIIIPESVKELDSSLFSGCVNLTGIRIPKHCTRINNSCFSNCKKISMITIPSTVMTLGNSCFEECDGLVEVMFEEGSPITQIGDFCFEKCSKLTGINIPSNVSKIGDNCFSYCSELSKIDIPSNINKLGSYCFRECSKLTSFNRTNTINVSALGVAVFEGCKLKQIIVKSNCNEDRQLRSFCFKDCTELETIYITSKISSINLGCFEGCSKLSTMVIKDENGVHLNQAGINLPPNLEFIEDDAFQSCSNITTVTVNSQIILGSRCFRYCTKLNTINNADKIQEQGIECFVGTPFEKEEKENEDEINE